MDIMVKTAVNNAKMVFALLKMIAIKMKFMMKALKYIKIIKKYVI